MKNKFLALGISIFLLSCSNESKMKSEIKKYLDKNAKDPKSYELVDFKVVDTITVGEIAKSIKQSNDFKIEDEKINIQKDESLIELYSEYPSEFKDLINDYRNNIETSKTITKEILDENKELIKYTKSLDVLGYTANHKYRIKNGFGALDLSNEVALFDKDCNLKNLDGSFKDQRALFRNEILKK
jgi:hypothetical protein